MSMVDNFAEQLNALRRFIQANHPGATPRSLEYLEHSEVYFPLEFRREHVSCTLYIELDSFAAESFMDDEGNRWRKVSLKAQPSWSSYGSVSVSDARLFVQLVGDVTEFAAKLLETFSEPFVRMVETAQEIADRKAKAAVDKCRGDVIAMMRANAKGMRVGQERRVEVPPGASDLMQVGEVSYWDGDRKYTTHVTTTRTFYMMRVS